MKYIITKPSAVHLGVCVLGSGDTKNEAMIDAFGPKPWTAWTKQNAKSAQVREVDDDECDGFIYGGS